ncbi:MAG: YggS family pyridoxal phosphate-dependent enzyme [Acidimicrobiales bacterium]|nr:YggS family pyridoxal phosphate-dependent enzyme [Acidimicrobiales bacterium]
MAEHAEPAEPTGIQADIAANLAAVQTRIAAVAGDRRVALIAVAKTKPLSAIAEAAEAGQLDIGESYAQELQAKAAEAEHAAGPLIAVRWHFIGGLQRNKIRRLGQRVHLWHSIDRRELVTELAKRCPGAAMLVQVNATGEDTKSGCPLPDAADLVTRAMDLGLDVQGLMTIGPTPGSGSSVDSATAFGRTRELADRLGLVECSMGMSADLESAIAAGATMVRIGSDIFGPREPV